jgi:hypothetical protein
MNEEGVETKQIETKQVIIYSGSGPFAIQLDSGLTIHVDVNENATLYFNKDDRPTISVKTTSTAAIATTNTTAANDSSWRLRMPTSVTTIIGVTALCIVGGAALAYWWSAPSAEPLFYQGPSIGFAWPAKLPKETGTDSSF